MESKEEVDVRRKEFELLKQQKEQRMLIAVSKSGKEVTKST